MSSAVVEVHHKPQNTRHSKNPTNNNVTHQNKALNEKSKRKFKHDRNNRKRSKSFSGAMICPKPVLPSKFLLGGNINDPLNLNSLQDEEINRAMNAITPKSSPLPTPPRRKGQIEVIIPKNYNDPLNLIDCADDAEYEQQLCSPVKKCRKKRLKKRRTISATTEVADADVTSGNAEAKTPETRSDSAKIPELAVETINKDADTATATSTSSASTNTNNSKTKPCKDLSLELLSPKKEKKRKSEEIKDAVKKLRHSMDKIVSPVVPQPGAWLKRMNSVTRRQQPRPAKVENEEMPQFKEKSKHFQYGNYNRYYGYRNPHNELDHRLKLFAHHRYLFEAKDILDIGCNIGHITLSVARDFGAKSVTGIDIDKKLIDIAKKNVKYYVKRVESPRREEGSTPARHQQAKTGNIGHTKSSEFFPISLPILYGPIDIPGFEETSTKGRGFPKNVTFKKSNYVLDDDSLLSLEQPQFDVILCLSITKWIHLNWGDNGMRQAFRRMYAQLKPGGKLILEPQHWASYKSKKKLTEVIFKHYNSIEFFPDKFTEYLLSPAVGFAKSEVLGFPQHSAKGFRRPIQVFTKSTMFPSERIEATPSSNITPSETVYPDSIYQRIMKTEKDEPRNPNSAEPAFVYSGILDQYGEDSVEANNASVEPTKSDDTRSGTTEAEQQSTSPPNENKSENKLKDVDKGEKETILMDNT